MQEARTGVSGQAVAQPKLSVVVPVYNVAPYLAECLDSILGQDLCGLEVVLVDDGSTDGSHEVAANYASRHPQVTLVRTANHGPGAARNEGLRRCHGEYLAFADSDDVVPVGAYRAMASTLDRTGSDFVVGSLQRLIAGELIEPPYLSQAHSTLGPRLSIEDSPEIMRNVFAYTKMFRRAFWDEAELSFPLGVRYEDQVAMTEAYLRAAAFDVIRRPVYIWRSRGDGSSITENRGDLVDLQDRIATKLMTTRVMARWGSPAMQMYWARHGLGGDLPLYFRHIPGCDDEYWRTLVAGLRELYAGQPPITRSGLLRVHQRLVGWLVTRSRRSQAETIQRWLHEHPGPLTLRPRHGYVVAELPWHDDPSCGIPPEFFWLADHELQFDARLLLARRRSERLEVTGWALIRGVPTSGVPCAIAAYLCSDRGDRIDLDVQRQPSPEATAWLKRLPQRYDDCGFTVQIDQAWLRGIPRARDATWSLQLDVVVAGIRRSGSIRTAAAEAFAGPPDAGELGAVTFRPGRGLLIGVPANGVELGDAHGGPGDVRQPTEARSAGSTRPQVD